MNIEDQVRNFIAKNLLFNNNGFPYGDDASFLEEGIVDSQGVMELVMFVEDHFKITVHDIDVTPDNFDSITKLANYIRRKQSE